MEEGKLVIRRISSARAIKDSVFPFTVVNLALCSESELQVSLLCLLVESKALYSPRVSLMLPRRVLRSCSFKAVSVSTCDMRSSVN